MFIHKIADKLKISHFFNVIYQWCRSMLININNAIYTLVYLFDLLCRHKLILIRAWVKVRLGRIYPRNWGDELNLYLIKELTGRKVYIHNHLLGFFQKTSSYLCIGSIFDYYTHPNCVVWGTGLMHPYSKLVNKPTKVLAVRGPLTKEWLNKNGVNCPTVYGDPALLLPLIVKIPKRGGKNRTNTSLYGSDEPYFHKNYQRIRTRCYYYKFKCLQ